MHCVNFQVAMTNKGNKNGGLASSARGQVNLMNIEDFPSTMEDANMDAVVLSEDDQIHEVPVEEEGYDGAENLQAAPSENHDKLPVNNIRKKRKYYYRHTQYQIKAMEAYYKICPHPDEKQRRELAEELGLHPLQVKFWFQNKRTQMKTHRAHMENSQLGAENENLCSENMKLRENLCFCSCNRCGRHLVMMPPEKHQLRMENERLQKKIEHVIAMTGNLAGNIGISLTSCSATPFSYSNINYKNPMEIGVGVFGGIFLQNIPSRETSSQLFKFLMNSENELKKPLVLELAVSAMQEVDAMARIGEPLWVPDHDRNVLVLNPHEYIKVFQKKFRPKQAGFRSESSRACAVVIMNPLNIVQIFMEMNKWPAVFSGIISKAMLLEVLSTGVVAGNYDGALQLISVKFQALSPAIPTRDCVFVRYCKQLSEVTWAVADVSIDALLPKGPVTKCQRKPSGFIVQAMPNDCSKITWVEHVEVQDCFLHSLSMSIISSGHAYGAKRWVSILERQCQRLASAMGTKDFPYFEDLNDIVLAHPEGKKCVLKLAERMILSFYGGITASPSNYVWTTVSGNGVDEVRIMTRRSKDDFGCPNGLVISASISFWIPVLPVTVFNYLRNGKTRAQWDILSRRGGVQEMAYIGSGHEKSNCVSILRVNNPHANNEGSMVILQECSSEATASSIVYAPVDVSSINTLLHGGNPDVVELLPSGFTILPSGPPGYEGGVDDDGITNGTLLSIAFQILGDPASDLYLSVSSVATVKNLVKSTIRKIQIALYGL